MSRIKIMSPELSNRIAAGEVIERPASVVKELVENAIDAGGAHIRIEIEGAGSRLISVSDDGCGMDAEDALLCIEPHGTSKLTSPEEMERIVTLGFRGEAIPSIASVSRFSLVTRTRDALEGTRVEVDGGQLKGTSPAGGPVGSTIQVRDLFFNTPARKKFLKSASTENHHIEEMILALALPHPEIAFELTMDGRRVFTSPASDSCEARLREFFGRTFADNLYPVQYQESGMTLTGFIAAPGFTRNSRREQRTFVNKRAVEAAAFYRGIREGYATLTEHGRFSPVVLFLEMAPEDVDVNVHPAKREVRFKHEYAVIRAVGNAIGSTLKQRNRSTPQPEERGKTPSSIFAKMPDGTVPLHLVLDGAAVQYHPSGAEQMELLRSDSPAPRSSDQEEELLRNEPTTPVEESRREDAPRTDSASTSTVPELHLTDRPAAPAAAVTEPRPAPTTGAMPGETADMENEFQEDADDAEGNTADADTVKNGIVWPTEILGVFENTYILASGGGNLIVIDQHAAHERILFEQLLSSYRRGGDSQALLLPETLELPLPMMALLLRNRAIFEKLGFDFEPVGNRTVMLNALPQILPSKRPLGEMIPDMLQELLDNDERRLPPDPALIARAACRAAVKAHDALPPESVAELLRQLGMCRQGTLCPHGRPTMITITRKELEKRFFRR